MLKKLILLFFITINLTNCGYTPMHSNVTDANFSITELEIEGNNQINNLIRTRLEKYLNTNADKKYELKIITSSDKTAVAKDSTGKTTHLKISTNLNLNIIKENQNKIISFSESLTIKKDENNYEQSNYERIVIENMTETLFNKMIFYLSKD